MSKSKNAFEDVLFRPSVIRNLRQGGTKVANVTLAGTSVDEASLLANLSGTYMYDPPGSPLKNTQQLNVDFSKFENHTFFNSAEMKVQTAFDKVINGYPFDGTKAEYQAYIESLSGFEKYVLEQFPKHKGYLNFKREDTDSNPINNYLSVKTLKGVTALSTDTPRSGQYVMADLSLGTSPFTVEMQLVVPAASNDNNVILQKTSQLVGNGNTHGLTIALSASSDATTGNVLAMLTSGSTFISASVQIKKGQFQHIATIYDRNITGRLKMYVDGRLASTSSIGEFGSFDILDSNITIASGSKHAFGSLYEFTPSVQLSGAMDELRIFESVRSRQQLNKFSQRTIFPPADKSLKLYFKFNEPSGSFSSTVNQGLILDYSGYGLHTHVTMGSGESFDMSLRSTASLATPLVGESPSSAPILFPSFPSVTSLGNKLLTSASQYDFNNPNLIVKLIPKHYLTDAQQFQGLLNENGDISENYSYTTDLPGGGRIQSAQIIASLLYLWAETFDEVKMFVDSFGKLLKVDYLSDQTISDQLLPFLAKYYGFNLPNSYADASMDQYYDGDDLTVNKAASSKSLQTIQNTIWRRVLTDLPELLRTRGTRNSIEQLFRSMGISSDGVFRIKEYGGSKTKKITDTYEKRTQVAAMLDFSGTLNSQGTIGASGKDTTRPLIQSYFLSGTRVEPGAPKIRGTMVKGQSNAVGDGLFTSGSWTMEGLFKMESALSHPITQSLMRLQTTGSQAASVSNNWLIFNVLAFKPVYNRNTGSIALYGRPTGGTAAPTLVLNLTGVNVFDGRKWHVSFGRCRNDQTGSYVSSSYFLRAGQMGPTQMREYHETRKLFDDSGDNVLNTVSSTTNASGSFMAVGSQSLGYDSSLADGGFLNSSSTTAARNVIFSGKASGIRFFSKEISQQGTLQHIRNFASLGVENPNVNFNFNTSDSGSFERLRINLSCDQPITKSSDAGLIRVFDFSQNKLHASGTGFTYVGAAAGLGAQQVIKPERFDYVILSPRFALAFEPNKVRIRSFDRAENVRKNPAGVSFAPLHAIPENEQPKDDRRLSIEVSSVQALNDDIANIFATLNYLDNAIGDPELVFSEQYKDLAHLRLIYFNRLTDKMSLTKFFDFFKWFDQSVGGLIEEMIPSTTDYLGTHFIVESHMLERAKFTYKYSDMYVGVVDRREASVIFLQQFLGNIRKF